MSAVLDSKLEMLLSSSSFWLWGGPFPVVSAAFPKTDIAAITLGHTREWLQLPVLASVVAGIMRADDERGALRDLRVECPHHRERPPVAAGLRDRVRRIDDVGAALLQTAAEPPNQGRIILAMIGSTWNRRNALTRMVKA